MTDRIKLSQVEIQTEIDSPPDMLVLESSVQIEVDEHPVMKLAGYAIQIEWVVGEGEPPEEEDDNTLFYCHG